MVLTKTGRRELRAILIQAAWAWHRKDPYARQIYNRLLRNTGNGKKAIVGLAKRIAAYDDRVVIIAQPIEQLTWAVKQYKGVILISSTIKFSPKHDSSGYMTIPVCLSGEKKPQINRRLCLISHRSLPMDQPITPCARSKPPNSSVAHR